MDEFKEFLVQHGETVDYIIKEDKQTKSYRGFGFVTYKTHEAAQRLLANKEMN
jgi:RNA recognition motif-containing protein